MQEKTTFAQLGHIEAVRQLMEESGFRPVPEPLRVKARAGDQVVNADRTLLEGIDFDLVYFPLKHLGYKAVLAPTGELYAALARPRTLRVTLGISAKLDFSAIRELWSGVCAAAREHGYEQISLHLQASQNGLCLHLSACGILSKLTAARLPKPESKDLLCVSGSLGAALLGLRLLEREKRSFEQGTGERREELERYRMLVAAYLKPELPAGIVEQLEEAQILPSCACFVTDGLADALLRLRRRSGLGAKVYADRIPFEGNSFALGKELGLDPVSAAMNGGEDHRLLLAIPILSYEKFRKDFQTFDIIGHLAQPDAGCVLVTPDGIEHAVSAPGWNTAENA
ncbi:MAG: thiamine-phosphate kinase [Bacteroidales bacterium]|nr:thiamine-phosphate kinase [Bacteroidales bacterium]